MFLCYPFSIIASPMPPLDVIYSSAMSNLMPILYSDEMLIFGKIMLFALNIHWSFFFMKLYLV